MRDLNTFQPVHQDKLQLPLKLPTTRPAPSQPGACASFTILLERDFREHRSPLHYAQRLGLSAYQLNQELRFGFGSSAYELIQERIHSESLLLLRETRLTVRQISFYLGISDPSWFTRCFRLREGCTPKQYRKDIGQNPEKPKI